MGGECLCLECMCDVQSVRGLFSVSLIRYGDAGSLGMVRSRTKRRQRGKWRNLHSRWRGNAAWRRPHAAAQVAVEVS